VRAPVRRVPQPRRARAWELLLPELESASESVLGLVQGEPPLRPEEASELMRM